MRFFTDISSRAATEEGNAAQSDGVISKMLRLCKKAERSRPEIVKLDDACFNLFLESLCEGQSQTKQEPNIPDQRTKSRLEALAVSGLSKVCRPPSLTLDFRVSTGFWQRPPA